MPAEYKYEFVTLGRKKALQKATEEFHALHKEMIDSKIVSTTVLDRFATIRLLLVRAESGMVGDSDDLIKLENLLGKDLGEEMQH